MSNVSMREASGSKDFPDMLTAFLYNLMKNELGVGIVEQMIINLESVNDGTGFQYCNGWLAEYANYIAKRLLNRRI